jgi:hypothetical protein
LFSPNFEIKYVKNHIVIDRAVRLFLRPIGVQKQQVASRMIAVRSTPSAGIDRWPRNALGVAAAFALNVIGAKEKPPTRRSFKTCYTLFDQAAA